MTIRGALRSATERLELHHVSNARLTAELLLAHSLSVEREYLYSHNDRLLSDEELQALEDLLYDRIGGVPLQYIVGRQEFYGRYFRVTPAVLIPRPETEYIVEAVLEKALSLRERAGPKGRVRARMEPHAFEPSPGAPKARHPLPEGEGLSLLDVGTGSGCIAVTLALEIPHATVFAADISEMALLVARENAANLNANVGFVCMDVLDAVSGNFDFIVSNPPYVRRDDITRLQREVREHEPQVALFSPEDELAIYRKLVAGAEQMLKAGGHLLMEVGLGMDERVLGLFSAKWEKLPTKADLQGIPRTVIAKLL